MKPAIFTALFAAAVAFFVWTVRRLAKFMLVGKPDTGAANRFADIPKRLVMVLIYFFGQKKVAEEKHSRHHLIIFWGFLVIGFGTTEMLVGGVIPGFSFKFIGKTPYHIAKWSVDVFNLLVLAAIGFGFFRRIVLQPRLIPMNWDAGLILGMIGGLMLTHFAYHGFHYVASPGGWQAPVSGMIASWASNASPRTAHIVSEVNYWVHIVILFSFLNYIPYSKHIHLLGSLPNIYFMDLERNRQLFPKLNFDVEDPSEIGVVAKIEDFSWKSLLDQYACTECARCTDYCPAYNTDKPLSPMHLIHDLRDEMLDIGKARLKIEKLKLQLAPLEAKHAAHANGHGNGHGAAEGEHKAEGGEHGHEAKAADAHGDGHGNGDGHGDGHGVTVYEDPILIEINALKKEIATVEAKVEAMPALVGGRIKEETLWSCTTCGACQQVCPVFIEHPLKIIQMRQSLIMLQDKVPVEIQRTMRNLERNQNPWGVGADKRMEWAEGLEVPTIDEHPDPEYILWVGCAGAFDDRIKQQTKAMVKVLKAAGVDYAVLGHREACTGDPARRAGDEMQFHALATQNVETLNEVKAKKVITSCPHCLHTLKNDYPQYGGHYEVIHHTQLIGHLLDQKKLAPSVEVANNITYHDSCYLGRWNGEYDAPRRVLDALPIAGGRVELERNREHGFCCGAGGSRMWMEEHQGQRVNLNRTDEILKTGVKTVAVACPFCNVMITDGMKDRGADDDVKVLDIAELVAKSLPSRFKGNPVPMPPQVVGTEDIGVREE